MEISIIRLSFGEETSSEQSQSSIYMHNIKDVSWQGKMPRVIYHDSIEFYVPDFHRQTRRGDKRSVIYNDQKPNINGKTTGGGNLKSIKIV